ncbi:hypothetical protein ABZ816_38615 [Actinosynnema sp. NPDC047251]|uniref:Uncharacterized protein n=1 Tax=Saccharothrix espanaensis (strain ATCC 51144 / DSM 44229 / JCM 9112 / NBRC 15066 / NRRL 15764) TaxID=1179773 RepID=K0JTE9_SACES|nr:hypothetical protein [Saccharothrix espanaensis]CCH29176.1 hypothetical protein BN6_18560 [Saccharothrix espanaensis DSM 44229]
MPRFVKWHPPLVLFTLLMTAATVVSLVGLVVDDRILVGSPIWFKPFKFGISLALYGATLAWMLTFTTRLRRTTWWAGTVVAVGGTAEMVIVVGQVLRGKQSHFNATTPFDAALFDIMGVTIASIWAMHALIAAALLRSRFTDRTTGLAIRLGLLLGLVGLALGVLMAGPTDVEGIIGAHTVGLPDGGPYLPVTGWSTAGGDLRVPHFVGIHALQVIPLLTLAFGRRANTRLVWVLTLSYAGLVTLALWQALRGQPVFRPDTTTLLALLGLAAATVAAAGWALRGRPVPTGSAKETVAA